MHLLSTDQLAWKARKKGIDTGIEIRHPFKKNNVPLYIANFVLMEYGTGAILVARHTIKDLEFALKYNLDVLPIVCPQDKDPSVFGVEEEAYGRW